MDKFKIKIGTRIVAAIVIIVVIMLSLTIAGINYISEVNKRMKDFAEVNTLKTELAYTMQNALRERALNMYIMTIAKDEFLKDEEYQQSNRHF